MADPRKKPLGFLGLHLSKMESLCSFHKIAPEAVSKYLAIPNRIASMCLFLFKMKTTTLCALKFFFLFFRKHVERAMKISTAQTMSGGESHNPEIMKDSEARLMGGGGLLSPNINRKWAQNFRDRTSLAAFVLICGCPWECENNEVLALTECERLFAGIYGSAAILKTFVSKEENKSTQAMTFVALKIETRIWVSGERWYKDVAFLLFCCLFSWVSMGFHPSTW